MKDRSVPAWSVGLMINEEGDGYQERGLESYR